MGSCYCDVLLSIQRYIYTACAKGRVISKYAHSLNYVVYNNFCSYQLILIPPPPIYIVVYDVLTGEVVKRLESDKSQGVVRDVSWHPTSPGKLVASSVSHDHYTCMYRGYIYAVYAVFTFDPSLQWDGYLTLWSLNQAPHYAQCKRPRRQYHW